MSKLRIYVFREIEIFSNDLYLKQIESFSPEKKKVTVKTEMGFSEAGTPYVLSSINGALSVISPFRKGNKGKVIISRMR